MCVIVCIIAQSAHRIQCVTEVRFESARTKWKTHPDQPEVSCIRLLFIRFGIGGRRLFCTYRSRCNAVLFAGTQNEFIFLWQFSFGGRSRSTARALCRMRWYSGQRFGWFRHLCEHSPTILLNCGKLRVIAFDQRTHKPTSTSEIKKSDTHLVLNKMTRTRNK